MFVSLRNDSIEIFEHLVKKTIKFRLSKNDSSTYVSHEMTIEIIVKGSWISKLSERLKPDKHLNNY